jgi:hypothetical protein
VPIGELTSRDAVVAALDEFDRIGREAFLDKYGFGPSRSYFVRRNGQLYDSKAIVGAAHGYEHPDRGPMKSSEFSGGEATVRAKLQELGFEVTSPSKTSLPSVWMVKAGRGDVHAPDALAHGVAAVEWSELGDLSAVSVGELQALLSEQYPDRPQSTVTRDRNELYAFVHEIEEGDLIVLPLANRRFSVGRVTGPYQHRPDLPHDINHTRPVEWLRSDVPRSEVAGLNETIGVRGFTVRKLPEDVAEAVRQFADGSVQGGGLTLPQAEVDAFAVHLETPEYAAEERDYKLAVHFVLRSLFAPDRLATPEFPAMLGAFFERKVELHRLDLAPEERAFVEEAVSPLPSGVTNAFINLCGGGFGVNNFIWIPGAIRDGLGEEIGQTFADLVASPASIAERIDQFRATLVAIEEQAQGLPSWHEKWQIVRPSLSFIAAVLAGVDPQRFTFYHQGKLRAAHEALVGEWPKGTLGEVYASVVDFVRDVRDALERQGAPVRDLIDAQSFLYLRDQVAAPRSWIFQANPEIYDIDGALHSLAELSWVVRQHNKDVHPGDRVYMWRAGVEPGILAVGTVISKAEERPSDPESDQFNRKAESLRDPELRVTVSVDRVLDNPLTRAAILEDEVLRDLKLIRQPRGTNFPVTAEQDERLRVLLEDAPTAERYFILQQRSDRAYGWDEEGRIYHFTPQASGAWKRLAQSPGAAFVYYRPGSGGGETARTYFGFGRIGRVDEKTEDDGRHFLAHVTNYRPFPRPVPAAEYDPRPNVQMSIAEIKRDAYEELLRRGGASSERIRLYEEPGLEAITASISDTGLVLSERTIRRYHLSLKTRGFVVLSGVSGTGKTWLAQAYADAVEAKALVVPVAPNWTTNEDLLGYLSPLDGSYHDTPFSQFLRDAAVEWEAAVQEGRAAWPYHLILDEMNLARVEYYFAKFLSAMEIRARAGSALIELAPGDVVTLGQNLSFVGTVNIDETTQMFADKVFDRAQLVELDLSADDLTTHLAGAPFRNDILEVWHVVRDVAPFAFRTADEVRSYVEEAARVGVPWQDAFDEQLFQKILPKLKGGDLRVETALKRLVELTADRYPLTHTKAQAMLDGFAQHGFSSYF